jgi:transposase
VWRSVDRCDDDGPCRPAEPAPAKAGVFDLPEPQPLLVTEHRAHDCRCAACGAQTRAAFPEGVTAPVQYGKRIGAFVVYLLHYQLLPEQRLAALRVRLESQTERAIRRVSSRTDAA